MHDLTLLEKQNSKNSEVSYHVCDSDPTVRYYKLENLLGSRDLCLKFEEDRIIIGKQEQE